MHLTRTISGKTLKNSETTRDCLSLLPLTLTPEDDGGIEKTASPSRTLSPGGAPAGTTPKAGDIAYDAPLGNLALFHKDFRYSSGLIILGRLDEGVNVVRQLGNVQVISNISK
ncbi:cyclophilin-like fold protein [Deinococcus sonorensis]